MKTDQELIEIVKECSDGIPIKVYTTSEIKALKLATACDVPPNKSLIHKDVIDFLDKYCGGRIVLAVENGEAASGATQFVNTNFPKKFPKEFINDFDLADMLKDWKNLDLEQKCEIMSDYFCYLVSVADGSFRTEFLDGILFCESE